MAHKFVIEQNKAGEYVAKFKYNSEIIFWTEGYANKAGDPIELIAAVRTVMQGRKYLTAEVAQMLADSLAQPTPEAPHAALSERELQTLVKIASGRRLSDIAEELMLSPKTVSVYRSRVLEKLKLSNNAELTVYAIRNQLV